MLESNAASVEWATNISKTNVAVVANDVKDRSGSELSYFKFHNWF